MAGAGVALARSRSRLGRLAVLVPSTTGTVRRAREVREAGFTRALHRKAKARCSLANRSSRPWVALVDLTLDSRDQLFEVGRCLGGTLAELVDDLPRNRTLGELDHGELDDLDETAQLVCAIRDEPCESARINLRRPRSIRLARNGAPCWRGSDHDSCNDHTRCRGWGGAHRRRRAPLPRCCRERLASARRPPFRR